MTMVEEESARNNSDMDDSILEVSIPPKPEPLLITLSDSDDERSENEDKKSMSGLVKFPLLPTKQEKSSFDEIQFEKTSIDAVGSPVSNNVAEESNSQEIVSNNEQTVQNNVCSNEISTEMRSQVVVSSSSTYKTGNDDFCTVQPPIREKTDSRTQPNYSNEALNTFTNETEICNVVDNTENSHCLRIASSKQQTRGTKRKRETNSTSESSVASSATSSSNKNKKQKNQTTVCKTSNTLALVKTFLNSKKNKHKKTINNSSGAKSAAALCIQKPQGPRSTFGSQFCQRTAKAKSTTCAVWSCRPSGMQHSESTYLTMKPFNTFKEKILDELCPDSWNNSNIISHGQQFPVPRSGGDHIACPSKTSEVELITLENDEIIIFEYGNFAGSKQMGYCEIHEPLEKIKYISVNDLLNGKAKPIFFNAWTNADFVIRVTHYPNDGHVLLSIRAASRKLLTAVEKLFMQWLVRNEFERSFLAYESPNFSNMTAMIREIKKKKNEDLKRSPEPKKILEKINIVEASYLSMLQQMCVTPNTQEHLRQFRERVVQMQYLFVEEWSRLIVALYKFSWINNGKATVNCFVQLLEKMNIVENISVSDYMELLYIYNEIFSFYEFGDLNRTLQTSQYGLQSCSVIIKTLQGLSVVLENTVPCPSKKVLFAARQTLDVQLRMLDS